MYRLQVMSYSRNQTLPVLNGGLVGFWGACQTARSASVTPAGSTSMWK